MAGAFLSPSLIEIASTVLQWANDFLVPENEHIHRPVGSQAVCPFVASSIERDSFYMVFHPEVNQYSEPLIEQIMMNYIPQFDQLWPFEVSDRFKKALLVIFPSIPEKQTRVLDRAQINIKSRFVQSGLMVGQFHPNCDVPSAHNRAFLASRSPVPLMAIRQMALHDILFLAEKKEWFQIYNVQFGHRFNKPDELESYNRHLVEYYLRAKEKFLD